MILQLIYYGHPALRKKCQPVVQITEDLKQLAQDMIDTMLAHDAVGLAAPQIARQERIFVTRSYNIHPDGKWSLNAPKVYVNPKIVWYSKELDTNEEGCISVPGLAPKVTRPYRVRVEALDLDGVPFNEEWEFYNARMIMHENDHLNGVLNIDRVDNRTRKQIEPYLREIKKKYNP